jgi:acylphosphatase
MMDKHDHDFSGAIPSSADSCPIAEGKQAASGGFNTYGVRVTGQVQGVFFRDFVKRTADSLMVRGWVRNEPDGSVRALLQSPETRLLELLLAQLRVGPPSAQVEEVYVEQLADEPEYADFEIRH